MEIRFPETGKRFCDRCNMQLREFSRGGKEWMREVHEIPDCIRYLAEKIEKLENK